MLLYLLKQLSKKCTYSFNLQDIIHMAVLIPWPKAETFKVKDRKEDSGFEKKPAD